MFFQFGFLERFFLLSPVYLLFSGILLSVFFITGNFKNKMIWIFDIVLIFLFFIFVFLFFYINQFDFIAGFPIRKISIFLIILILNIIFLNKQKDYYDIITNFIFLLSAIAIFFFEKLFIVFSALIIINLLFLYSAQTIKIEPRKQIFYMLFLIFLLGFCFNLYENDKIYKFCLTGIIALMFGLSVFNTAIVEKIKTDNLIFFLIVIIYFVLLYKILTEYKTFFVWPPVLLIVIILFLKNSFYFLTEEKYKKFIYYDFINNAFILFLFLITAEFKFKYFILSLIFFYFSILTSAEFIRNKNNDNLTVTYVRYNIYSIKEKNNIILNLFLSLIFNIYIIFELTFSIYDDRLIKMLMFFILLIFLIAFLNKIFIFFSFIKKFKLQKLSLKKIYRDFNLIFLSFLFYCILIFNINLR